ncbi:hypothetical protein [Microcystis aeruginosa]|jgi:hypothetical protein|uniref:hypothetical protein n=1 Tax=Microcystis aeruginosa TaxID=1126 RepID=UPI0011EB43F6|nr:hypothetical protein [Microcystis aeruginosa]NCR57163.1 hypothetical protein [Microcystis aeruginosa LL13-06]TYT70866.1 hypothetical protein FXO09_12775 [Microcystis aeruginosa KLA2]
MNTLEKTYFPFLVTLTIVFGIAAIPIIGIIYAFPIVFIPTIAFAICNFIVARDGRFGTAPFDLIIMILSIVTIIPVLGWLAAIASLVLCIISIVKFNENKKRETRTKNREKELEALDNRFPLPDDSSEMNINLEVKDEDTESSI